MLAFWSLLIFSANSQNSVIEITYNDQSTILYNSELTVAKLKSTFNISEFNYLEDLSGQAFYPHPSGSFSPSITSVVFVRQVLPEKIPTVINATESRFLFEKGSWSSSYNELMVGYEISNKYYYMTFIQFKDLSSINIKRKISKIYLRMIGTTAYTPLPVQIFVHRCETDWQDIKNWDHQPIYKPEPFTSIVVREVPQIAFHWDVTDIVEKWLMGSLLNNGIVIKTNNTLGTNTYRGFYHHRNPKGPVLLVFYSN